jgi:hypothetical protein
VKELKIKLEKSFGLTKREIEYPDDVKRIQKVLFDNGYSATANQCVVLWERYSESMAAGWMNLPEKDEDIFEYISYDIDD